MNDTIVVKIGTESLMDFEQSEKVQKLVDTIISQTKQGIRILLVTSGAVGFGRKTLGVQKIQGENRPLLAAIGWDPLMTAYRQKFTAQNIHVAGILVTHADIEENSDRRNAFVATVESAWKDGIIPIVNENDALSSEELEALKKGADNDKNALLLAKVFQAQQLVLITNTNGVYRDKNDSNTRIHSISSTELTLDKIHSLCPSDAKSDAGTGGMSSKLSVAQIAGELGITTHICDGINSGLGSHNGGTTILPSKK